MQNDGQIACAIREDGIDRIDIQADELFGIVAGRFHPLPDAWIA